MLVMAMGIAGKIQHNQATKQGKPIAPKSPKGGKKGK